MVNAKDQQHKVAAQKTRQIPLEEPSNVRVAPRPNDLKRPSLRPNNGKKSRPSSSRLNNDSLRPNNGKKSRPSSSRPNNGMVSLAKNTEKSGPSSSRPNNVVFSLVKNTEKSRPPRFRDGLSTGKLEKPASVGSKDDSNCTLWISKKSHASSNIERSNSRPNRLKAMVALAHMAKNVDAMDQCNNFLGSISKGLSNPGQREVIVARKDGFERSKLLKSKVVSTLKGSNFLMEKEHLVPSRDCLNEHKKCQDEIMVDKDKDIQVYVSVASAKITVSGEIHKEDIWTAKEAPTSSLALKGNQVIQDLRRNSRNSSFPMFGKELSSHQPAKASCMGNNMEQNVESPDECIQLDSRNRNTSLAEHGITDDDKSKGKRKEPLLKEKLETHDDDSEEAEKCRLMTKRRRENEEEDDGGDQNIAGVEDLTAGLTTETAIVKDHRIEVKPFVSESVKLQRYSSLPIDEPIWSGIFKIGSKEYVSLAAHLSTKYCEKVWKLSRSLRPVVEVTKLSRLEAWPKSFEASRPTDNDIALYFLPHEMRPDENLDQLVKEVVENDMVLRAVVGEAEMLIFPSILLPEQHQTFQRKPYLWGVFKRRQDKVAVVVEEQQHGKGCCAQEQEGGKQRASHCGVGKEGYRVAGLNMEASEEAERRGIEQEPTPSLARSNTPCLAEGIARPSSAPTTAAAMSANHGQIHSSSRVPQGTMYGFFVRQTPRIAQLMREMEREGAVVVAMQGEMIGSGLGQPIATG